jgi:hypothetical protein
MAAAPVTTQPVMQKYRNVFSSREGVEVLADLMGRLGLLDWVKDDEGIARHNAAVEIMSCCGIFALDYKSVLNDTANWQTEYFSHDHGSGNDKQ